MLSALRMVARRSSDIQSSATICGTHDQLQLIRKHCGPPRFATRSLLELPERHTEPNKSFTHHKKLIAALITGRLHMQEHTLIFKGTPLRRLR